MVERVAETDCWNADRTLRDAGPLVEKVVVERLREMFADAGDTAPMPVISVDDDPPMASFNSRLEPTVMIRSVKAPSGLRRALVPALPLLLLVVAGGFFGGALGFADRHPGGIASARPQQAVREIRGVMPSSDRVRLFATSTALEKVTLASAPSVGVTAKNRKHATSPR